MYKFFCALMLVLSPCQLYAAGMRLTYTRMEPLAPTPTIITGHGTAFGISKNRIMTAAHNVLGEDGKPYETVLVEFKDGWVKCSFLCCDPELDICLLEPAQEVEFLEFGEADVYKGTHIILSGASRGELIKDYKGVVTKRHYSLTVRDLADMEFDHGVSGGPVLCDGKVVGMAVVGLSKNGGIDHTKMLFLPVSILKEFLKDKK